MSVLYEKLAEAGTSARELMVGDVNVCRACGCDDNNACTGADSELCSWFLLDVAEPSGICSACAERAGWHRFFFVCEQVEAA